MIWTKRGGWLYANPPNVPFVMNTQSPQADRLWVWWPLGTPTAGALRDRAISQGNYELTQFNTPTWTSDGQQGRCIEFNAGASEYAQINLAAVNSAPFTMTCWFCVLDATRPNHMLSIANVGSQYHYSILSARLDLAGDYLYFYNRAGVGTSAACNSTLSLSANQWYLGCGVFSKTNHHLCYVNGAFVGSDTTNISPGWNATSIGRSADSSPVYASVRMRDVRFYKRALSPAEVWAMWDRETRWELYAPAVSTTIGLPGAAAVGSARWLRIGDGLRLI